MSKQLIPGNNAITVTPDGSVKISPAASRILGLQTVAATKSGKATTDVDGLCHVTFVTPFLDDSYTVQLTCEEDPVIKQSQVAFYINLTEGGFDVQTRGEKAKNLGNVSFSWLATRNYNE